MKNLKFVSVLLFFGSMFFGVQVFADKFVYECTDVIGAHLLSTADKVVVTISIESTGNLAKAKIAINNVMQEIFQDIPYKRAKNVEIGEVILQDVETRRLELQVYGGKPGIFKAGFLAKISGENTRTSAGTTDKKSIFIGTHNHRTGCELKSERMED